MPMLYILFILFMILVLLWIIEVFQNRKYEADRAYKIENLKKLAKQGDPEAQYELGLMYKWEDEKKASELWKQASKQGHVKAMYQLADMYERTQEYPKAIYCYKKAIQQGNGDAQLNLGNMYEKTQEYEKAEYWYTQAAKQGINGAWIQLKHLQFNLTYCVYITTNKKNNKRYIGKTSVARHKAGYIGSGIRLNKDIDLYGEDIFTSKILSKHKTEHDAYKAEIRAIAQHNAVNDPMFYNITAGGDGHNGIVPNKA